MSAIDQVPADLRQCLRAALPGERTAIKLEGDLVIEALSFDEACDVRHAVNHTTGYRCVLVSHPLKGGPAPSILNVFSPTFIQPGFLA